MDSPKKPPTVLSICTGYAGLEIGLERAIGNINVLAHVEIESFSLANLVKKMETGLLAPAPIWSDLTTFPAEAFSGCVDYLIGGYPCQDFSQAGKREGFEGKRGKLWSAVRRAVRLVRPRCCIFENVEGHITLGLDTVLSDLGELGYRFKVGLYSASEAGAPHQRNRVFILAYCPSFGHERRRRNNGDDQGGVPHLEGEEQSVVWVETKGCRGERALAYDQDRGAGANNQRLREGTCRACGGEGATGTQTQEAWPLGPGPDQHPWEPPRTLGSEQPDNRQTLASMGGDADGVATWMDLARLSGLSYSELEEIYDWMERSDDRIDELRSCGNGVVPQQAEVAIRDLMRQAT